MEYIAVLIGGGVGLLIASAIVYVIFLEKKKTVEIERDRILKDAHVKANEIMGDSRRELEQEERKMRDEITLERTKLTELEARFIEKDKSLEEKRTKCEEERLMYEQKGVLLASERQDLDRLINDEKAQLLKVANMGLEEAKKLLFKRLEDEFSRDIAHYLEKKKAAQIEDADKEAKRIISMAIQRLSSEVASESTATVVELPNDEVKGRIIGREGRNIHAFEEATGVDVIVDDTPGSILISGFDLMRRYIAKKSLEELIQDGRVHPARIEEVVDRVTEEVHEIVKNAGEKSAYEVGLTGVHPNLIKLIGRLKFRTSYGQNVLKHSLEVGNLCAIMAGELGYDSSLARKAGFLHDIGKAVTHEIEGSHAIIGANILRKFGFDEKLVNAVEAHHNEVEMQSAEAYLVAAADAISGARPGARRDSLENYVKRLKDLEDVAMSFDGVKKVFAIQAGREIRVLVDAELIDDLKASLMARDIAQKIEDNLTYPGMIKVNLIRETRVTEFAR